MTLARILFFSFLATSASHAVEMILYHCEAGDFEISLMVFPEDEEERCVLSVEQGNTNIDLSNISIEETNSGYHIKASAKEFGEAAMVLPKQSNSDVLANDNGLIDYQEKMTVMLEMNRDGDRSSEQVTCSPYGFTEEFFDVIMSAIP